MAEDLISIREAARLLGLGYHGGRALLLRAGVRRHVYGPRLMLVDRRDLSALLKSRGEELKARGEALLKAA